MGFDGGADSVKLMIPITSKVRSTKHSRNEPKTLGTGFSLARRIRANATVDSAGNLYEMYIETDTTNRYLKIVRTAPNGTTSYAIRSIVNTNAMVGVLVAVGSTIHVVYRSPSENLTAIYYFTFSGASVCGNGAFTALPSYVSRSTIPALTGNTMTYVGALDIVVDNTGAIHVATMKGDGTTHTIQYTVSFDGGASFNAWQTAFTHSGGYNTGLGIILGLAVSTTTGAVYMLVKYFTAAVLTIRWKASTTWATAQTLTSSSHGTNYFEEHLVALTDGKIMCAYWANTLPNLVINIFTGANAPVVTTFTAFAMGAVQGTALLMIVTPRQVKFVNVADLNQATTKASMVCFNMHDGSFSEMQVRDTGASSGTTTASYNAMLTSNTKEVVNYTQRGATVLTTELEIII